MPDLPSFRNPPIVEVAIAVQYEEIPGLLAPHLGVIWEKFRDRFPGLEQHPPVPTRLERAGVQSVESPHIQVSMEIGTPRVWMIDEAGQELLQIQNNRFVRNWRKYEDPQSEYPRYNTHIKPKFLDDLRAFRSVVVDMGFPDVRINQCELTYVNHIRRDGVWEEHGDLAKIFVGWRGTQQDKSLENIAVRFSKEIESSDDNFLGRLHVDIRGGYAQTKDSPPQSEPVYLMNIIARGRPTSDQEDGIVEFLDIGRAEIVTAFDELTTEAMHAVWEKE